MRRLGINAVFAASLFVAWGWYHVLPPKPTTKFYFLISTNIPGWDYKPILLSTEAKKILATGDILNGTFFSHKGERLSVFLAEWKAGKHNSLDVVAHTPDICWSNAGWISTQSHYGDSIEMHFSERPIPFETRIFEEPRGGTQEIAFWCTLVNGQIYSELNGFAPAETPKKNNQLSLNSTARRLSAGHFLNALSRRNLGAGTKQFLRISTEISKQTQGELSLIQNFINDGISLHTILGNAE
jgi:hypothetical protein